MNDTSFIVSDRLDTGEIFDEWSAMEPFDDYAEPNTGWAVKSCKVYEDRTAIILFENPNSEQGPYYRWYLFRVDENGRLILNYKLRTKPDAGVIEGFGYDGDILYVCKTDPETGEHELRSLGDGIHKPGADMRFEELELLDMSEEYFLMYHAPEVLLVKYPKEVSVLVTDEIHDIVESWKKDGKMPDGGSENEAGADSRTDTGDTEDGDDDLEPGDKPEIKTKKLPDEGRSGLEELNGLIGLREIKTQIKRITAYAKMQKAMSANGAAGLKDMNLNMVFSGAPGTAKTTVARILAKILRENGLLSEGGLVEVGRADLVAKYMGQTAPKVREVFEKAQGKLLFIDEAYSLVEDGEGEYGDEAIAAIVQEMENRRDDLVVVFAGYEDKMDGFIARNPGLRSRIPYVIHFADYSAEELTQIVLLEAKRRGFTVSADAVPKIRELCAIARENSEFGNGRFSRNLTENAVMSYAMRLYGDGEPDMRDENRVLRAEDFELPSGIKKQNRERKIGFCA